MNGRYPKSVVIIIITFLLVSTFSACKKDGGEASQSPSGTTQATAAKTSAVTKQSTTSNTASSSPTPGITDKSTENTGQGESSGNTAEGNDISVGSDDTFVNTIDEVLNHETIDLGGRTVLLATFVSTTLPTDDPNGGRSYILNNRIKAAEKTYNFKMEYKVEDSSKYLTEITNHVMAGLQYADIVTLQTLQAFPKFVKNNIIVPWNNYVDFESPVIKANPIMYYGTRWNGRNYGTPMGEYERSFPDILFNSELIEREGQPDVLDLVESKQWKWDKLLEISMNCTRDTDGNGVIDQWGITSTSGYGLVLAALISNGVKIIDDYGNGYQCTLSTTHAQRALQFISDLASVYKVFGGTDYKNTYGLGRAAFLWSDNILYLQGTFLPAGIKSKVAPHPMGYDVDNYQNSNTAAMFSILSTCPIPRELAVIMTEACMTWDENLNPIPQLQELFEATGQTRPWEWENSRYKSEREYELCIKGLAPLFTPNFTRGFSIDNIMSGQIATPLLNGTKSVSQAVDAVTPQIDAIINEYR